MSDKEEPKKVNPFVKVKVKCPICEKISPQYYVKSKLYQPVEIEKDHHVLSYNWNYEEFNHIKPENFFIWHCPHCHFADENDVFRGKINRSILGKIELMSNKIIKTSKDPDSFLVQIGKEIDYTDLPVSNETAILTHILAYYIQKGFLSPNNRIPAKMAKICLRLAWLYRERKTLGKSISNIPDGFISLEEFLASLKKYWDEIPQSEEEALRFALEHYSVMLDNAGKDDNVKKEITLMFLLLNLNRRLNELDEAYGYVRSIFSIAMKTRQGKKNILDKAVQSGGMTDQQLEQIKGLITWLSNAIEEASSEGDAINEEIFWQEYEEARNTALNIQPMLPKKVMSALKEKKFHEISCRKVASLCKPPKGMKVAQYLPTLEELKEKDHKGNKTTKEETIESDNTIAKEEEK